MGWRAASSPRPPPTSRALVAAPGVHAYHWKELTFDAGSRDLTKGTSEANDPRNIFKVRSYINATTRLEIDAFYADSTASVLPLRWRPIRLDARVGYRLTPGWDVSLIGNNLLHERHLSSQCRHRAGNL